MDDIPNEYDVFNLTQLTTDNATLNGTASAQEQSDFVEAVRSIGVTALIVISVACVMALSGGCYCAVQRTKRKASKVVSIRSIDEGLLTPAYGSDEFGLFTRQHSWASNGSANSAWSPRTHVHFDDRTDLRVKTHASRGTSRGTSRASSKGNSGASTPRSSRDGGSRRGALAHARSCGELPL